MMEITSGTPENLVIATGHGKITGDDYERVLIPAIETKFKAHKKIRMLYQLAKDFSGFTAEAIWDDAKIGFAHLTGFEAVAVVTDAQWIRDAVKFFAVFLRCPVKVFTNDELADALTWVATAEWRSVRTG